MTFLTEKDTEWWLVPQQRAVRLECGRSRVVSASRLVWKNHDFLTGQGHFSSADLIDLAEREGREIEMPFEISFPHVVSYLRAVYRSRGVD